MAVYSRLQAYNTQPPTQIIYVYGCSIRKYTEEYNLINIFLFPSICDFRFHLDFVSALDFRFQPAISDFSRDF